MPKIEDGIYLQDAKEKGSLDTLKEEIKKRTKRKSGIKKFLYIIGIIIIVSASTALRRLLRKR